MSNFGTDTRREQIERGEIYYFWTYALNWDNNATLYRVLVVTGASSCEFSMDIKSEVTFQAELYEGVANTSSSPWTLENMNRNVANSIITTVDDNAGARSGGSRIAYVVAPAGIIPPNNPFNHETGPILKPNTSYMFQFTNDSNLRSDLVMSAFLREI